MQKIEENGVTVYLDLTPEQYAEAILFTRERQLPVEYSTHRGHTPNLHVIPRTDEDPDTPEWDDKNTAEFEAALG